MADASRDGPRQENEVDAETFSGSGSETDMQIESSNLEESRETNDVKSLGNCAMEMNETGCCDDASNCISSEKSKCTETGLTEHEENALLFEESSLQDLPENNVVTEILEILPEDPTSPVTTKPAVQLEEEMAVKETEEIESQNDSADPVESSEQMQVEPALSAADATANKENACEIGENDVQMSDDNIDEEPHADKELVSSKELDSERDLLSADTSEPTLEISSLGDETLPELNNHKNFDDISILDTPLVSSPAKDLDIQEKSVSEAEKTLSQHIGFSERVESYDMEAVSDKNTNESNCENTVAESKSVDDMDANGSGEENLTEESKMMEDLETDENAEKSAAEESTTEDLKGNAELTSVDLERSKDLSDFAESVDCLEPATAVTDNGCDDKFVDDGKTKSDGLSSSSDAENTKTSDALVETIHVNEDDPDQNPKSDDSLFVKISQNCDDMLKKDGPVDTSDEKSNQTEVSLVDTIDGDEKKLASEEVLSSSSVNDDEVETCIKEELDKKSISQDKAKTGDLQTPASDAGVKSVKSGAGTSSNRTQQKTGKNSQTSKGTKQQECIVCRKMAKCKYNIVRNDDTKHLCDDKCFQLFRTQPTTYLQADGKKPGANNVESCPQCQKPVPANTKGRNSLKIDKEIKKFCSAACLNVFKKAMKPCASCGKDLRNDANAISAPVEGEGSKDFCCHACLVKYEHSTKQATKIEDDDGDDDDDDDVEIVETTPAPKIKTTSARNSAAGKAKCSVCSKQAIVRQKAQVKGVTYKFCGDACLSAFRIMHHLSVNQCDNCDGMYSMDDAQVQTIQFEGLSKTFCSAACLSSFKTKKQRIVTCSWCYTRKSNFDMVERLDANNKYQMFCSLNCLSLYRVNLQANSNQSVACDQCRKCVPALYHLTMSDASVRNFCGYNCVMAFQAQFSQPSATSGELPTPGDRVTANAANTQPAQSAVLPSQPARNSPYGTRNSSRAAKSATSPTPVSQMQSSTMPVISNIVSLAESSSVTPASHHADNANVSTRLFAHIGVQTMAPQEVIVQPPPPKQVKNKALLCKPFMQTKATSCRPHTVMKGCQTEENWEPKKLIVPCPVPTVTPAPMMMYSNPVPYPVLIPIPVPIPVFIPTTKKSTAGIMKKIKELQERVPSDPFEAELLMMAEAVANANKTTNSDSETEDEDADGGGIHVEAADNSASLPAQTQGTNGELAEDMLQMALRMAEMQNDQTLDLEDAVDPTPIRAREPVAPVSMPVFDTIATDPDILHASHMMATPRGRGRGKRRGGSRGGRGSSSAKKPRVDEEHVEPTPALVIAPPVIAEPPADANCILKFTYGINAYKHWAIQKNALLERVAPPKARSRQRLFKLDLLQCSADELNYALCLFVKEVRKPNGEEYAPDSIYYLCLGMQEYLYENGRIDNIFTDFFYEKFTECLNEVLSRYEVRLNAQGMLVCRIEEEHLWEAKQLGAHSPHVLLNTLIYFNTKHFMLRTPEDHLSLSFSHIMKHWKKTSTPSGKPGRSVYLRYYAPSQLGGDAAQKRKKEDLPVFEQAENVDNPLRCPVKLYEFYLSKCPESIKNRSDVFYLVPERSCVPDSPVWYSTISLSLEGMTRMLNRLRVVREIQESQLTSLAVPYYN